MRFVVYNTPTLLLVTTVNTKRLGGTLSLDYDVQPIINYFNRLGSHSEIQELVNADVVTKAETIITIA